ncbi:MAG: SAM-dependent methyltransferase, partial [Myxococcales bacterium]|nr:SAM-dependent methyltransferase [Myxococcales bacterium]
MPSDPGNRQGRPSRDARWIAATVLGRVTEDGAFASAALAAELGRARPDRRDASLATEILYGTLRILPAIDEILAPRLRKPLASLDPFARAVLRTAIYQLGALDRVPARAVVHASVELVR